MGIIVRERNPRGLLPPWMYFNHHCFDLNIKTNKTMIIATAPIVIIMEIICITSCGNGNVGFAVGVVAAVGE